MSSKPKLSLVAVACAATLLLSAAAAFAAGNDNAAGSQARLPAHYTAFDIGGLGGVSVSPQAIDSEGRVVGFSARPDSEFYHGFVTGPNGTGLTDVCPNHPYVCAVSAISDAGEIVGQYDAAEWANSTAYRAAIDGSGFALLAGTPTSVTLGAYGVNTRGQVVGIGTDANYHSQGFASGPDDRHPIDLGALTPGGGSTARAINSAGVVVGDADTADGFRRAFVKTNAASPMRDLGAFNGGDSSAVAISDNGYIAGSSYVDGQYQHAFAASLASSQARDLGTLGGSQSFGTGVNSSGIVIGQSSLAGDRIYHAFVATAQDGMVDLNTLTTLPAGVYLLNCKAINTKGQIACVSYDAHAYLLTPDR